MIEIAARRSACGGRKVNIPDEMEFVLRFKVCPLGDSRPDPD
jgi:hypothetical protein